MLRSLSPVYSVQHPSPWAGAGHTQGVSSFLYESVLESLTDVSRSVILDHVSLTIVNYHSLSHNSLSSSHSCPVRSPLQSLLGHGATVKEVLKTLGIIHST